MKGAIFDLDGTTWDSMPVWGNMGKDLLDKENITYPDNLIEILTPLGLTHGAKYLQELGLNYTVEEIFRAEVEYGIEAYKNYIPAKEGAVEYLRKLKNEGVKLCALTASPHEFIDPCIRRLGLDEFFEFAATTEDIGYPKSDIRSFEEVLKRLGTAPCDTFMFEDNYEALATAKKAGLKICGVYDAASKRNEEKIKEICDRYIYSFKELL